MPSGKREAAAFHQLSALAAAQPEEIRTRRTAAETAYIGITSRLGAAGTYDLPGTPSLLGGEGEAPSLFKEQEAQSTAARAVDTRFGDVSSQVQKFSILDPEALQKQVEGSSQFRIMSRLTAEAEQLIAREGPLYQEMKNSLQLPIIEGAGAIARENAEQLKRAAARGGSARRSALEAVQRIRSQERINSQKVQQLAQTNFQLDVWARENARTTLEFGQNWAANLGGIRESYNSAMDQASQLMLNSALPIMFQAKQEAAKWRAYAHSKKRAKLTRWIDGIVGIGAIAGGLSMGGEAGAQLAGAGFGGLREAIGGPQAPV